MIYENVPSTGKFIHGLDESLRFVFFTGPVHFLKHTARLVHLTGISRTCAALWSARSGGLVPSSVHSCPSKEKNFRRKDDAKPIFEYFTTRYKVFIYHNLL
jgi:hypothetical protein